MDQFHQTILNAFQSRCGYRFRLMPMERSHHPYPGEHRWPVMFRNQHSAPYNVFFPKKTQKMVYSKGKLVYELVDPDGNVYVLQAHEEKFPIDSLVKLGEQLKLPKGWQFRTPSD
jgi:hypothetical protein